MNPPPKQPLTPARTTAFGRDMARCRARGYDMDALRVTMGRLINRQPRECHLADDWLLVYRIVGNEICFARTGTHTDIFEA